MRGYYPILMILMLSFLLSCESDIEKKNAEKELLALHKKAAELDKEFAKLKQEQEKLSHCSAKERFAFLYSFEEDKPILLKYHEENFVSIEWQKKEKKYFATVKIQPKKFPFVYRFVVFLYDKKGLILGNHYEKPGIFQTKISPGKLVEKKFDFKIEHQETPEYFSIVYHN